MSEYSTISVGSNTLPTSEDLMLQITSHRSNSFVAQQGTSFHAHNSTHWILDSGASDHMTGNPTLFCSYAPCYETFRITLADGSFSLVAGKGSVKLSDDIVLNSVLHVPALACNLISISKLTNDLNCGAKFSMKGCVFQEQGSEKMLGSAREDGGMYYFEEVNHVEKQAAFVESDPVLISDSSTDVMLWHRRLGHPSFPYLQKLLPNLFINKNVSSFSCDICPLAKHTRVPYPPKAYVESTPFSLIHSDVWGPAREKNISGSRWFITFIDDHTRVCWVYLLKEKSDTASTFRTFHAMVQTQFSTSIKILRTDNGKEYFNSVLGEYLSHHGILHQSSCPDTPQQNGVAERKNRHLLDVARSIMFTMNVPKHLWGEAVLTACYLINRMPSRVLQFKSPLSCLLHTFPSIRSISSLPPKVFGCVVFVHTHPQHRSKLDPKSHKCVFIGYSPTQRGYKCYSPSLRKVFVSMDVSFFETQPYFSQPSLQGESLSEVEDKSVTPTEPMTLPHRTEFTVLPLPPSLDQETGGEAELPQQQPLQVYSRRKPPQNVPTPEPLHCQESTSESSSNNPECEHPDDLHLPIALRKGTRSCTAHPISNHVSYDKLSPGFRAFNTMLDSTNVPRNIEEALNDPKCRHAVVEEMDALTKNETWETVELPRGKQTVGCKWVFTIKFDADGSINRYKARLVAKGFTQTYGIDYQETFAPVAKLNTIRVLLSLAANLDWPLQQLDVKNAFLNGDLHEEVYMDPPPGFREEVGQVCKLRKSLYGLKQSPREWFEKFTQAVKKKGFLQAQTDHTLFHKHSKDGKVAILIVYVDDIIITGDDHEELDSLKSYLATQFELKDLGALKYFLGMEIARSKTGITISQRKYILDLLQETGMLGCKPADTPMEPNIKLGIEDGKEVNKEQYQRLVGKLIYLSHTRPDIAFAVSLISQFMHSPKEKHLEAVYRVLRYLKNTPGRGLFFQKGYNRLVEIYTDADWAGSAVDRRSTSGYCTYVWGNLVTWRSKKQTVVARSSAEAEFRALAHGVCEGVWLRRLLEELKISYSLPIRMYCDNKAAVSIAQNPVHHDRTKHVEVDRHFIKEKLDDGSVCMTYIPTKEQTADILTKSLHRPAFEDLIGKLGMINIYLPT